MCRDRYQLVNKRIDLTVDLIEISAVAISVGCNQSQLKSINYQVNVVNSVLGMRLAELIDNLLRY